MNYLWAGMILIGIIFGAFNGRMEVITNAALDSSKEAVTLYDDRDYVVLVWDHGDCGTGRDHRKCGKKNASGDPFSFS